MPGCSWRDKQKRSVRKSRKMRGGGSGHLHKNDGKNNMRGGGGCGYNPQRGRSMSGGGRRRSRGRSRGRGRGIRKLSRKRTSMKRKGVIVDDAAKLLRRR